MLNTTLPRLRCPICAGELDLRPARAIPGPSKEVFEICSGRIECGRCHAVYPILAGVAVLVPDVGGYLLEHVKGISALVPDDEIPEPYREDYLAAREGLELEPYETDLESERMIALYFLNHYLDARGEPWWNATSGASSSLIDRLIRDHWEQGPMAKIGEWVRGLAGGRKLTVVELGCGVAGLVRVLAPALESYLGVDSSFSSVALGRHLALGVPYGRPLRIPADLLRGPVSREVRIEPARAFDGSVDLVAGEIQALPLAPGQCELSLAVNVIDMLEQPELLPEFQYDLLNPGGTAIQCCPYIWREDVAAMLRENLPGEIRDSAGAASWLYERAGFGITRTLDDVPWLFFKHVRQLEIYSVHLLGAIKPRSR